MGRLWGGIDDDEIAEALQQIFDEAPRILTGFDDPLDRAIHPGTITGGERIDDVRQQRIRSVSKQRDGPTVVDPVRPGTGYELVEDRQCVTHRTSAGPDDQRQHALGHLHAFTRAQLFEIVAQGLRRHQAERIVVGPRTNRADDLLGLGRGEDEFDVRRWLFDDLEQSVEALRGDHVRLIEDEHLVPIARGRIDGALTQVTGIIDAVVAGRVDLDDIERTGSAVGQIPTARALPARHRRRPLLTVETPSQDPRRGGLSTPARAREQVGMVDAATFDGGLQRIGHMLLTDDLVEGLWAVSSVQCGGHVS